MRLRAKTCAGLAPGAPPTALRGAKLSPCCTCIGAKVGLPRRSRRVNFPREGELSALGEGARSAS